MTATGMLLVLSSLAAAPPPCAMTLGEVVVKVERSGLGTVVKAANRGGLFHLTLDDGTVVKIQPPRRGGKEPEFGRAEAGGFGFPLLNEEATPSQDGRRFAPAELPFGTKPEAALARASALRREGKHAEAARASEEIVDGKPEDVDVTLDAYGLLIQSYAALGQDELIYLRLRQMEETLRDKASASSRDRWKRWIEQVKAALKR